MARTNHFYFVLKLLNSDTIADQSKLDKVKLMTTKESSIIRILRYLLAIVLPPIATLILHGLRMEFVACLVLTLILSSPFIIFIIITTKITLLNVLITFLLTLPGAIYAIWLTSEKYLYEDEIEDIPEVMEPKPQRIASAYQKGFLPALTPSPIRTPMDDHVPGQYSGKYSPITISSYSGSISVDYFQDINRAAKK